MPADDGRLEVIALDGIPEIVTGDDLPRHLGDAIERAPEGLLPLRPDDVLVVTQKVVSKAEGAVVDLTTIDPRPEAIAFAERWDRDPRQVEVVLREARRVVRMANGVIITETHHGFVCANGGIDASNVGPGSGQVVTLLPRDPDASAASIRAAIADRFGVDVPVVVSDSFGRPWRWGIVDVAIGVSGMLPLDDLRGAADHDGRIMRSTVRAVADQVASAAELAFGKATARPAALVRGASPVRGEATIRDALIPGEMDLFR
jgi:coenzyme F420-0:L-glutamate ligase/coenzyme F420-1:gamma-L-glutamate ligase